MVEWLNRPCLCGAANRKRRCTDKDKNPFLYFGSHAFCSGSRVGCEPAGQTRAARLPLQRKIRDPESFRGLLDEERWSVSEKAPLQN